jgi:hypothetical protein
MADSGAMPRRAEVRITLRLPPDTYAELKAAAEQEVRSVNGQIELAIKEHLDRRRRELPRVAEDGPEYRPGGA